MHQSNIVLTVGDDFEMEAARFVVHAIRSAIILHGHCTVGLSGGNTPIPLYRLLRNEKEIDWSRVIVFLIDERYVPPDHPDSNQRMIRETLLQSLPIPEEHITFPDTTLPLDECVRQYAQAVQDLKPSLLVLGMGDDGHIASLFPPLPREATGSSTVIATRTDRFPVHDRVTVTLRVLLSADSRLFLLSSAAKYDLLVTLLQAPHNVSQYPAHALLDERTTWIVRT